VDGGMDEKVDGMEKASFHHDHDVLYIMYIMSMFITWLVGSFPVFFTNVATAKEMTPSFL
jgi:hypothetical protein